VAPDNLVLGDVISANVCAAVQSTTTISRPSRPTENIKTVVLVLHAA
jgi:hypothetical protein